MKEDPHLQLPWFNDRVIKRLRKRRVDLKISSKNAINEFVKLPVETIRELDLFEGDKEKQLDLEECIRAFPHVKCHVRSYANVPNPDDPSGELIESEDLHASDYIKLEFRIEFLNVGMEENEGYVHTRNFPYLKKHSWHIMVCDGQTKEKIFMFT